MCNIVRAEIENKRIMSYYYTKRRWCCSSENEADTKVNFASQVDSTPCGWSEEELNGNEPLALSEELLMKTGEQFMVSSSNVVTNDTTNKIHITSSI